jgi:hypothetical protein
VEIGYHQVTPSLAGLGSKKYGENRFVRGVTSFAYRFNSVLEKMWPAKLFAANLFVVAKKVEHF